MTSPSIVLLRTQPDDRLVALARSGHERAFEAIVERYRRPLLRACRRVLPDARAEDALQHALLAAWGALRRGDDVADLRPWLYRIARNTALNQLRMSGYDHDSLSEELPAATEPGELLEHQDRAQRALSQLSELPERQRDALVRVALHGQSHSEVADDFGVNPTAVRQLVRRARAALRAACGFLLPPPVVLWLASGVSDEPLARRVALLAATAGSAGVAATVAKTGATVVVAGGVAISGSSPVAEDAEPVRRAPPITARATPEPDAEEKPKPAATKPRKPKRHRSVQRAHVRTGPASTPVPASTPAPAPAVPRDEEAEDVREEAAEEAEDARDDAEDARDDAEDAREEAEDAREDAEDAREELAEEAEEEREEAADEAEDSDE